MTGQYTTSEPLLRLFIDSGPFVALYYKDDQHHREAANSFAKIAENGIRYRKLYTSDYVLDEAITTCRRWTGSHELSVRLGTDILASKSIVMLKVDERTIQESWELYMDRDDVKVSFTDATCATIAKAHGVTNIFTYDARDFRPLNLNVISSL